MFVAALDPYYLGLTAIVSAGMQIAGFAIAFTLQTDAITDFWSALTTIIMLLLTLNFGAAYTARNILATIFGLLWAVRLGGFQLFRMIKMGGDTRFDEMRSHPLKFAQFWLGQFLWTWTITMPINVLNSPAVTRPFDGYGGTLGPSFGTAKDIVGLIFFVIGFLMESMADITKYRFKSVNKPPKGAIIDVGPWKFSRRPNYFGEILIWLGIYLLCISPANQADISYRGHAALLGTVVSPLFTFALLMFLSGVPLAEKPSQKKYFIMSHEGTSLEPYNKQREEDPWRRYKAFRNRTPLLIPMPAFLYKPLPKFVKTYILFDLPLYNFDEHKDGPGAIAEWEKKQGNDERS